MGRVRRVYERIEMRGRIVRKGSEMQQSYENQPLIWHEVPANRFSRDVARYKARTEDEWHDRLQQSVFPEHQWRDQGAAYQCHASSSHRSIASSFGRPRHSQGRADSLTRLLPKILIALAIVFVVLAAYGSFNDDTQGAGEGSVVAQNDAVKSTDRSKWAKGKMPYLYQIDSEWATRSYAGGTIADSACGPTCMSMVYICLTGKKDRDPAQMATFSEQRGFTESGMTTWAFMTEGARMLGLTSRELPADESIIRAELAAGHPIIVSVSPGDFTEVGHFIVLESADAFGRILVRDPNSPERSAQAWDLSRILSQTRNLWAFSV